MNEELFQAFSHPCRRQIIHMLRWRSMSAGEIAGQFTIAQPSVSRHLDVLKRTGAVTTRKRGTQVIYSLNLIALQVLYALGDFLISRLGSLLKHITIHNRRKEKSHGYKNDYSPLRAT